MKHVKYEGDLHIISLKIKKYKTIQDDIKL